MWRTSAQMWHNTLERKPFRCLFPAQHSIHVVKKNVKCVCIVQSMVHCPHGQHTVLRRWNHVQDMGPSAGIARGLRCTQYDIQRCRGSVLHKRGRNKWPIVMNYLNPRYLLAVVWFKCRAENSVVPHDSSPS